ncbi:MAG: DUF58 domain-containing protein [Thermoplasmatota archaeon]
MKAAALVAAGVLCGLAGLMLGDLQLIALGVVFCSFVAVSHLFRPAVAVERPLPYLRLFEGDVLDIEARVINRGGSAALLEVYDFLPAQMRIHAGSNRLLAYLRPGEQAAMGYTIEAPLRGHYILGPVLLRRRDFFFLFFDEQQIIERGYVSVYPRPMEIHSVPIASRYMIPYFGMVAQRQAGMGSEFYYIRDYVMGDAFKRINWKASVRHRKWLVNEYEKENLCDVMLFVDARWVTGRGSTMRNPLEFSVKAAVSLCTHLLKGRNEVGLVTYGEEVRTVFPSVGERQLETLTTALVGTYARGNLPLLAALEASLMHLRPRSTLFVISSLDADDTLIGAVQLMKDRGHEVVILSPSLISIEMELSEGRPGRRVEIAALERENLISDLRARGAVVMDWDTNQPLFRVLDKGGEAG